MEKDEIEIYNMGGYIEVNDLKEDLQSIDEICENDIVYMNFGGNEEIKINDICIFSLVNMEDYKPFSKDTYETVNGAYSINKFDAKEEDYIIYEKEKKKRIKEKKIEQILNVNNDQNRGK